MFNKSFMTNFIAACLMGIGFVSPVYGKELQSIGIFALSGAFTNWLAVYMLFEKVPFLYGSGVIPNRFEDFKKGINSLIMGQFFNEENIKKFMENHEQNEPFKFDKLVEQIDYHRIFNSLTDVIQQSQFGGMLAMFGGTTALEPMRSPFTAKMKTTILEMTTDHGFQRIIKEEVFNGPDGGVLKEKVEKIVSHRLDELTPQMVKKIIQEMIQKHLGWLVVWGGVFGGLIGLLMTFIN